MKKLLFLILCSMIGFDLFTETLPQYEFDFIQNEEEMIQTHSFISKQQAMDKVYESLVLSYDKMNKSELKQMLNAADVILVEEITTEEARKMYFVPYFYSVQVKSKDGRILSIASVDAQTGESAGGIMMDEKDKSDFIVIMNRSEIIEYVKKHFTFAENSKLIIRAIYDYGFYYGKASATYSGYWKYRITIENGTFVSPTLPASVDTLFVTPFIEGYAGKREEAAADNDICPAYKHRIYTYNLGNDKQTNMNTAEARVPESKKSQDKYIGVD